MEHFVIIYILRVIYKLIYFLLCKVENSHKILIFMATQDMVDYHTALFSSVLPTLASFFKLHGNMTQIERTEVFKKFRVCTSGVLICTVSFYFQY